MAPLQATASIQISKPTTEVFNAIIDPVHMSNYFIAESSGTMETGKDLNWKFPEFDMLVPVKVLQTKPGALVSFQWEGSKDHMLQVDILLTERPGNATLVKVTEGSMENNEEGIKWLKGNTEGWANFLACLKAYLEYNINLRKGAFDYMKTN
ncbi:SRPBCC domain-containing protein [Chitinophaga arvensicola]|uniref:Uncharacterized conserved protein YndB, AHSA1/START domain n=1 Tax=Chitinophaga arvensicola TaxID=29529 RepID=A0A1I0RPZ9_9BACT|nr:SRPBCC domain-containing protein [Chitinophaga arvensicola]SEW43354.1 Uncharacterized conserved protein YndB, AHSA1/START domain [Chitinophaga arvensicola]